MSQSSNAKAVRTGRVVITYGKTSIIESAGERVECFVAKGSRHGKLRPICGDQVEWLPEATGGGLITGIAPRRTELARPDHRGQPRIIAANVDVVVCVVAAVPEADVSMLNRYVVAAELQGIQAMIAVNKAELFTDEARAALEAKLKVFATLDYPIFWMSAETGDGVEAFAEALAGKVTVLSGVSGVGKSSISTLLLNEEDAAQVKTGKVSDRSGLGRHTTTTAQWYELAERFGSKGSLIDTPGVRDFGLWSMSPAELAPGFKEFRPYLGQCRFNDCTHLHEPNCAIRDALAAGDIDAWRYEQYQYALRDMEAGRGAF